MDTEQYEEAVRDYEKVYQTEKTSGQSRGAPRSFPSDTLIFCLIFFYRVRPQTAAEEGSAGTEEEQEERLLQGPGGGQERHGGGDQEGLPKAGSAAPPRSALWASARPAAAFETCWRFSWLLSASSPRVL